MKLLGWSTHRDDDVRAVAVAGDDLEALDGLGVADNVVQRAGTVLTSKKGLQATRT